MVPKGNCMTNNVVYVNFADGLKRMMNNPKLYVKLLTKFRDGTKLDALEDAFAKGDKEKLLGEAHTLKGIAANLSLAELSAKCFELEAKAKEGVLDPERVETLKTVFDATLQEIDRVIAENG